MSLGRQSRRAARASLGAGNTANASGPGSSGPWSAIGNAALQTLSGNQGNTGAAVMANEMTATPQSTPTGESIANWALEADQSNDTRFENETTKGFFQDPLEYLKYGLFGDGYAKCNQFVSAAYSEGAGLDFPEVDGRPPVVSELADSTRFTDELSYSTDANSATLGSMVLWYHDIPDSDNDVHHSAIVTGYDPDTGQPLVTYAGTGESEDDNTTTKPLSDVTNAFRGQLENEGVNPDELLPVYRSWKEDNSPEDAPFCTAQ